MQAYDEDFFYEALGLEELDVVNVDRVTLATEPLVKKKEDNDNTSESTKGSKGDKKNKKAVSNIIPLTIGRARAGSSKRTKEEEEAEKLLMMTPKKREPTPTTIPAARPAPPAPAAGASMAAILKRETEQQEKERQKVWFCKGVFGNGFCVMGGISHFSFFPAPGTAGRRAIAAATGSSGSASAATTTTPAPAARSTTTTTARGPSSTATAPTARSCCQAAGPAATRGVASTATAASATGGPHTATSTRFTTTGSGGSASRWRQATVAIPSQCQLVSIGWSCRSGYPGRIGWTFLGRIGCQWRSGGPCRWFQLFVGLERVLCYHAACGGQ
jgi:hypothetical protein